MVGLLPGLPAARVVGTEQEPVDDRTRLLGVGQGVVQEPGERPSDALGRLGNRGRGRAERVGVELVCRPEAHEHHPSGPIPVRIEDRRPAERRADLFLLGHALGVSVAGEGGKPLRTDRKCKDIRLRNRL